jgi:hypothetical protein
MDCHSLFPPREETPEHLLQHGHIVLDHGINDRCRNCHDPNDRNKLILHGGQVIGYSEVVRLCSKCHGPTYRDWQKGVHGRANGYWDTSRGPRHRLKCIQCHDPHAPYSPAMDPLKPLPGPDTLRMRAAHGPPEQAESEDQLGHWRHIRARPQPTGVSRSGANTVGELE